MTERTPEERASRLNEDDPEVEGHRIPRGAEEPSEPGRAARRQDADDDEGADVEGHRFR